MERGACRPLRTSTDVLANALQHHPHVGRRHHQQSSISIKCGAPLIKGLWRKTPGPFVLFRRVAFSAGGPVGRSAGRWARSGARGMLRRMAEIALVRWCVTGRSCHWRYSGVVVLRALCVGREEKTTNPTPAQGWGAKFRTSSVILSLSSAPICSTSRTSATGRSRHRHQPRPPAGHL